jgi:hypothetical protein
MTNCGDGPLAGVGNDKIGRAWGGFDVDLFVRDVVGGEEAFRFAAVPAPGRGVEGEFHNLIL